MSIASSADSISFSLGVEDVSNSAMGVEGSSYSGKGSSSSRTAPFSWKIWLYAGSGMRGLPAVGDANGLRLMVGAEVLIRSGVVRQTTVSAPTAAGVLQISLICSELINFV